LNAALRSRAAFARASWERMARHRSFRRPYQMIFDLSRRLDECEARSKRAMSQRLALSRRHLDKLSAQLDSLSPLAVLKRGYSITQRASDGRVVRSSAELQPGDEIRTRFAQGSASSRVEEIEK
jgi:exodeoxyribonuclease VII large subunit